MSDAKAKAEARRAKILARTSNSVAAVTSEEPDESLYTVLANTEVKVRERPLASRRRLVNKEKESDVSPSTPLREKDESDAAGTATPVNREGETETEEDKAKGETARETESVPSSSAADASLSDSLSVSPSPAEKEKAKAKVQYAPAKSLEEIEREIAERTAQFDSSVRSDSQSSLSKKKDRQRETASKSSSALKVKPIAVDPSSVLRLIRVLMIVVLGAFSAYKAVELSRSEALKVRSLSTATASQEFISAESAEFLFDAPTPSADTTTTQTETETQTRTWPQYFQQRLTRQMECSATAVGLVWWMSRFFSTAVHSQFKQQPKQVKPLEMVMDFLTNGINSFLESIYAGIGEVSLHLFVLIISATLFTAYFSSTIAEAGLAAAPPGAEL